MDIFIALWDNIKIFIPTVIAVVGVILFLFGFKYFFEKRFALISEKGLRFQIIMLVLTFAGMLIIILVLPISESSRGQLLSLIGLLLSAAIALSSTTLLGNAMAGLMLRVVKGFRSGDFIRIGEHFGRVSERGLFHVEIQNEDRDLTTLPNLFLVTNPVKVIRSSGTFISATVSLGYDIPRTKIEKLLMEAAIAAELSDPFLQILELGDFSITYRVAGLLTEVKQVISTRSRLHAMMLDKLHESGVEIVSPNFINTRTLSSDMQVIPHRERKITEKEKTEALPETKVFDKAEQAESREKLIAKLDDLFAEVEGLKKSLDEVSEESAREAIKEKIKNIELRRERLTEYLKEKSE